MTNPQPVPQSRAEKRMLFFRNEEEDGEARPHRPHPTRLGGSWPEPLGEAQKEKASTLERKK